MEIDLLGRFEVRRDGRVVEVGEFGGRRVRQLIRILASARGTVWSRDALIDAIWAEHLPADPDANLNVLVNRARRALGGSDLVQTAENGYLLTASDEVVVDAERFELLARHARDAMEAQQVAAAVDAAQDALVLWGEPLPEDAYSDWAREKRERLERIHHDTLQLAATANLEAGRTRAAIDAAAEAVASQPLRESAYVLLMRSLAADGDHAAATSVFNDLRTMLADELGVEPSPEAVAARDDLRRDASVPLSRSRPSPDVAPLVGRAREIELLASLKRGVAMVSGRAGTGKSRLLHEVISGARLPVLSVRALPTEQEDPWSLVAALLRTAPAAALDLHAVLDDTTRASLVEVLPELQVAAVEFEPKSRRALIQYGIVQVLEATGPSIIVLDDVQWADSSSLDALAMFIGRSSHATVICAYRPDEIDDGSATAAFLSALHETRPLVVELSGLDADAVLNFVSSPEVASAIVAHTDQTPFAVLQTLRALEREGLLTRAGVTWHGAAGSAPVRAAEIARAGQREAVWRQFAGCSPTESDLLALLALVAKPLPLRLLCNASGLSHDNAMSGLRNLSRHSLVRHERRGFTVDHDLVRETIEERLDAVRRVELHGRLADALETEEGVNEEVARHRARSGDSVAAAAAFAGAAKARLERFANAEARQLVAEGLELGPTPEVRVSLLEVRGETFARDGDFEAARTDFRNAIAEATSRPVRSRLFSRLAALTAGTENLVRADELADIALAEAGDDPLARARAVYVRALVDMNLDWADRAEDRFDEALRLFTTIGDTDGMADILDARAMSAFGSGDITGGVEQFDRVARLFADNGNWLRVVTPRSTSGHGLSFAGQPERALADTTEALELARRLNYAEGEAMVLWHHGEVLVAAGRPDQGLAAAEAGVVLARRLGHRGWTAATLCGLGVAHAAVGDFEAAAQAYRDSLVLTEHLVMFKTWGHARLARLLVQHGDLAGAATHVDAALGTGPGLAQYEARLARCELAVARNEADASALVQDALDRAVDGGHGASAIRLAELGGQP